MADRGRKAVKIIIVVFIFLIAGGFALNWFLTHRLQSKLRNVLSEEVSKATDGFYDFSFDDLKVDLFSGELSIKGIEFTPDSVAFNEWQKGDSLPDVYYDVHVGEIHFKGINLTWLLSYKKLDFSLFEVKSPNIKIHNPPNREETEQGTESKDLGPLYDIVSPYIDVLTVGRINLLNMNVSYVIEDESSPVVYALRDANFRAYNFRLDENSSESGKLLYCDNFEFIADSPQELLYSDQIILKTANIKLSTLESLIRIEGVHISPKDSYWDKRVDVGGGFLNADIASVDVNGLIFKREKGNNYLEADSFKISSTDIKYLNINNEKYISGQDTVQQQSIDSIISGTWSLYSIVSPILNSISIAKIAVEKTKFNYTLTQNGYTDVYTLAQFDFHANNFLIDSLSEKHKKFWYVDDFTMDGADINGQMMSNNADITIAKLRLSTTDKQFGISDIKIKPLSISFSKSYIWGGIKSINIDGLDYTTGVSAEQLKIESPTLEYLKVEGAKDRVSPKEKPVIGDNIFDLLNPYATFLSVKRIDLSNANVAVHNKSSKEVYRLKHLNFYATDFLVDENTKLNSRFLFAFDDIGISFRDFDNLLPGNDYRLQLKYADISTLTGKALFRGVKLIPQEKDGNRMPDVYYAIETPLLEIDGFDYDKYLDDKGVEIKSVSLNAPKMGVIKLNSSIKSANTESDANRDLSQILTSLKLGKIDVDNAVISYQNKVLKDSLQLAFQAFRLNSLQWDIKKRFSLGEFVLHESHLNYVSKAIAEKEVAASSSPFPQTIEKFISMLDVGKFSIADAEVNVEQPEISMNVAIPRFDFSGLNWHVQNGKSHLRLNSMYINNPSLKVNEKTESAEKKEDEEKSVSKDFYSKLKPYVNTLTIGRFGISDAKIDYSNQSDGKESKNQTLNTTSFELEGLTLNTDHKEFNLADIRFNTKNLHFPIMDGFYTMAIGNIDVDKKGGLVALSDLHMIPAYPKTEFAYVHPKHKDWFDVKVGDISLSGVDYPTYFSENILRAKTLKISDVVLQNFKNQQIEIQHNVMPLLYEKIQYLPVKFSIDSTDVTNFSVMYEELPKKGTIPGKIHFDRMNGRIANLTNIATYPQQYMILNADGLFMGNGHFTAKWHIPVSPDNDCFILEARMDSFDMKGLNDIFTPLAKAEIGSGMLNGFNFRTEASSKQANAEMLFLYSDLKVNVLKGDEGENVNGFMSTLANALIRSNNPNKKNGKPREANIHIERDAYHSTFNYFWQILQPALAESAGVSQGTQNFAKKVGSFFSKVKNFFTKKDNKKEDDSVLAK
ncbi:MAG: hypothetical protein ACK5KT_04825 [Dysgonomonas sp.]